MRGRISPIGRTVPGECKVSKMGDEQDDREAQAKTQPARDGEERAGRCFSLAFFQTLSKMLRNTQKNSYSGLGRLSVEFTSVTT